MTTDTVKKEIAVEVEIDGKNVTVGGMCKGFRYDSSKYVYHAWIYHNGCCNFKRTASGSLK